MTLKGNKGEWSEIYVLFKLLAEGKLFPADMNLNRIENLYYPIIKILRKEVDRNLEFVRNKEIKIYDGDAQTLISTVPVESFVRNAELLLCRIKKEERSSFSANEAENFMQAISCHQLKARSRDKSDIKIVIHDQRTGFDQQLGFSIKSRLGASATLINASLPTNFLYKISQVNAGALDIKFMNQIRQTKKFEGLFSAMKELGWIIKFHKIQSDTFTTNLKIIDTCMPELMAEILLLFYERKASKLSELVELIAEINPLHFNPEYSIVSYEYKIKSLLTTFALGMNPDRIWDGNFGATGGYIIVKEDGDVLCYHIFNWDEFRNYLYLNTKLETPSTGKHEYGEIYLENGEYYIKLNLQIRFSK